MFQGPLRLSVEGVVLPSKDQTFAESPRMTRGFRLTLVLILTIPVVAFWPDLSGSRNAGAAPAPPSTTTSRYMKTVDPSALYTLGCNHGKAAESGVVILDFGQPWWDGSTYGTNLFDKGFSFASIAEIENASTSFLQGYWDCSPSWTHLRLVIGTNNYRGWTNYEHGQAWGELVNRVNNWIARGDDYSARESARGGNDMELDWNTPAATRAWADGYASASQYPYYNYGDCAGCPSDLNPSSKPHNGWTLEDVWYVSWGAAPAWPLPQIYNQDGYNAAQWQALSRYSYEVHGEPMVFLGALTQWSAAGDCCTNAPGHGWTQLWDALASDHRTAQNFLDRSTDITWDN